MNTGERGTDHLPLRETLAALPVSLRGFFQKVVDGVKGALQATLIDTLVGEFHEKFNAMWNAPGDRDAAKAVRQCDRTHREAATKIVNEVLASQLTLLARALVETLRKDGIGGEGMSYGFLSIIESKVARLEGQVTAIEGLFEA